jgi:hypothetical protein
MMTRFSFEVPLAHLNDFKEQQDFLFALSFLFENPHYVEFYVSWPGEKWIDNSFNELRRPDAVKELAKLVHSVGADKVIAPDSLDWGVGQTLQKAQALADEGIPKDKIVVVVQDPDWIGYLHSHGFSHFAFPYAKRYCSDSKLRQLKGIHFLGLVNLRELTLCQPPSCDTSIPIKLALRGQTLQDWKRQGCPHIHTSPDFFNIKMSPEQITLAKQNITALKAFTTHDDIVNHPRHYTQGKIEVLDFILDQQLPYLAGNVIKYICRYRYKGGVTDLRKAEFYLRRLIEEEEHND